jgi:ornithine carbamoyltransferase
LDHYVDAIVCRLFKHDYLYELSRWSHLSVVNALTDFSHPCQILADVMTLKEEGLWHEHLTLTWVGDPNNVLQSWIELAMNYPLTINVSCPECPASFETLFFNESLRNRFNWIKNPKEAVKNADVIYADTWISMGQEQEAEQKRAYFQGYTIDADLIAAAPEHLKVLHCLPAKRGEEIDDFVLEKFQQVIFRQAENRLHIQKAILWNLLAPEAEPNLETVFEIAYA